MGRLGGAPGYTVVVHRDGSVTSREIRLPVWIARVGGGILLAVLVGLMAIVVAYAPIVAAAAREPLLRRQVARLTEENQRVGELAAALDEAEARYAQLRGMLGAQIGAPPRESDVRRGTGGEEPLFVAPPQVARAPSGGADRVAASESPSAPRLWPLSVPSYRTRGMVPASAAQEEHPGMDLAVPIGSDVRASGGGLVRGIGEDAAYGLFVRLQHPGGYETTYGHLSRVLVTRNQLVRAGQVIALTGNSGRSTAPHLHFEIRLRGRPIDPLTLVREGR